MGNKTFDLLARGLAESFGTAEVDGVGLDQIGIELVLADQLAKAIAYFGATVVSVFAINRLGRMLLRFPGGRSRLSTRTVDMTQGEFAERVGISQNYLSTMERGKVEVGAEILLRISLEFSKNIEWLLTGKD